MDFSASSRFWLQMRLIRLNYSRLPMPFPCVICACVTGSKKRIFPAALKMNLLMKQFIRLIIGPLVSLRPAISAKTKFDNGSRSLLKCGRKVWDSLLLWPMKNVLMSSGFFYAMTLLFPFFSMIYPFFMIFLYSYVNSSWSVPKTKAVSIVLLPQPVLPIVKTRSRSLIFSRAWKVWLRHETKVSKFCGICLMVFLSRLTSLKNSSSESSWC